MFFNNYCCIVNAMCIVIVIHIVIYSYNVSDLVVQYKPSIALLEVKK